MAEILGGTLKKKSLNTIPFTSEMRTLAYIMLSNLYPVTNLTTLFGPRTIFLYDLFTHKEIDICNHIYYLLTKSITKRNSRTILPFPSLIMALIAKTRLKQSYHHVKGLFDWCSNGDPKQSPHHWAKNLHFSNPKGWCWGRRWGHGGRDWQVHISPEGLCITIFLSTSTGIRLSWSSHS